MCGIVGILDRRSAPNAALARRAADALQHRGPDDAGFYSDDQICLAFRRLSVIDLETGHQPMANEDASIWTIFNGEIYNYRELREQLTAKGHRFKSSSDTEVLVHLYEEYGDGCLEKLDGMFGLAIWDTRTRRLLLGRDRLGIKPLYYVETSSGLAFASELKALLQLPGVDRNVDPRALSHYLSFRHPHPTISILGGIQKLPAAHAMICDETRPEPVLRPYWDLAFNIDTNISEEQAIDEFDRRLTSAVESHLVSDVPVGVLLSGGLDSTAMVACASELGVEQLKTFSVAFDTGGRYDERGYARQAADRFQTDHHEVVLSPEQFIGTLFDTVWHADEPLADLASVPLYAVARLAREHVTVVLSGEGSDELFGGYPGIENHIGRTGILGIPTALRAVATWPLRTMAPSSRAAAALGGRIEDFSRNAGIRMTNVFSDTEIEALAPELRTIASDSDEHLERVYGDVQSPDILNQILYMYARTWLPEDLLNKADRMTMAHGLELRVPFLDNQLIDFVSSLPPRYKLKRIRKGEWSHKHVLRKAMEGRIPNAILERPKQGFPVPAYRWLESELSGFARDRITSRGLADLGLQPKPMDNVLRAAIAGDGQAQRQAWVLIVLSIWCEQYLK